MDKFHPLDIPGTLRRAGIVPSKGLGQNFLSDDRILSGIVACAQVTASDQVLEIGPGLGSLTRHLASSAGQVIAVELDRKLFPLLEGVMSGFYNVALVNGDILEQDPAMLGLRPGYTVAANIPYYITSAVIRHLLESEIKPQRIVLTVQREVARRICAMEGDLNLLALSVQVYGKATIPMHIPAGAFYPPPKVDSSVVRIELYPRPLIPETMLDTFFTLCKAGFGQKRKTLRNSLSAGLGKKPDDMAAILIQAGIDPVRRAETLTIPEWAALVLAIKKPAG